MAKARHSIMISSTYKELMDHRAAVSSVARGLGMFPIDMGDDSAIPEADLISASLEKVDEADAYIGLISYRYGQIERDAKRNKLELSLTEMEFRRAVRRKIPICMFIMHAEYLVSQAELLKESDAIRQKLEAFKKRAKKGRIYAEFKSVDDLKAKVTQSLNMMKELLDKRPPPTGTTPPTPSSPPPAPSPPAPVSAAPLAFLAHPPYVAGYAFQGRVKELSALRDWAGSADTVMLLEAIGGMGKSMVTWEWVTKHAGAERADWAGMFWYSFYERGADMRDFCATALAYMEQRPRAEFLGRPAWDNARDLVTRLRERPWLLALDGLERVLVAYHRADAAQAADDDVATEAEAKGSQPTACIRPEDEDLLRQLCAAAPSKILITSRLTPRALINQAGIPLAGLRRLQLTGLDPRDAEAILRAVGITGDGARIQDFLERRFGCHPLIVGVVAGLVRKHHRARNDFDRWATAEDGGGSVDLTSPDIQQRKTNILKLAFDGLDQDAHRLTGSIAMISAAVDYEILEALNPARRAVDSNPNASEDRRARERLNAILDDLELRGLLQRDPHSGKFDLHPVVRGYAVRSLAPDARAQTGQDVADYFSSRDPGAYEDAGALEDLQDGIQVVRALALAGKLEAAFDSYFSGLSSALYRLDLAYESLGLLETFFPNGWGAPPLEMRLARYLTNDASLVLADLLRFDESLFQGQMSLKYDVENKNYIALTFSMLNLASCYRANGMIFYHTKIIDLCKSLCILSNYEERLLFTELQLMEFKNQANLITNIEKVRLMKRNANIKITEEKDLFESRLTCLELDFMWRRNSLTKKHIDSAFTQIRKPGFRFLQRYLFSLVGVWRQSRDEHAGAIASFDQAIEMAHAVRLRDPESEARRAVSLARLNTRRAEAEAAATAVALTAPLEALAELWLVLGDIGKARDAALRGFKQYWADGPPYCFYWELEACRRVLKEIGEPEPVLPPFDPANFPPLPFEADIERLIEEYKAAHPRESPVEDE